VLVDRFFLSTYAYQGEGRGVPEEDLRAANRMATNGLVPDQTLLLAIAPEEGLSRAHARGERDRMERAELAFHERVARAFERFATPAWQRAHPECGPIELVDAGDATSIVFDRILGALGARWPDMFPGTLNAL